MSRIVVTGIGVITSLGHTAIENRNALVKGISGIGKSRFVKSKYTDTLPFAEIKIETNSLAEKFNVHIPGTSRTMLLALHAMQEAITNSNLSTHQLQSYETAIINASTVGGMYLTDELYKDANAATDYSAYLSSYDCASVAIFLQKHFGIKGVSNTINTACSSGANAIMYGARLIKNGLAKRAVVGGVDCLSKFTINGFNSLNILSSQPCRPFDKDRNGLNLGEGAAYLVIEKEEDVKDKRVYAILSGSANTNDAFHPSSLSDKGVGPVTAMQGALKTSGLQSQQIDFVNTHGTGTENNDRVEGVAMQTVFNNVVPPFASAKSKTGHTLGAASAVETVFAVLSLMYQEIYPSLSFAAPDTVTGLIPNTAYNKRELKHVMVNSFGFGGNCSSLVVSSVS